MESLMHEKTSPFRLMHLDPHDNSLFKFYSQFLIYLLKHIQI